jgi:hypothetical protein
VGERVWKYIRLGAPEECWPWIGATFTESGYGMIQDRTTTLGAHRAVWASINGPIPAGHIIMHTCDNRPCCNPAHLKLGTYRENTLDMIAKGRGRMQFEAAQRRLEVAAMREEAAEVIQEND